MGAREGAEKKEKDNSVWTGKNSSTRTLSFSLPRQSAGAREEGEKGEETIISLFSTSWEKRYGRGIMAEVVLHPCNEYKKCLFLPTRKKDSHYRDRERERKGRGGESVFSFLSLRTIGEKRGEELYGNI